MTCLARFLPTKPALEIRAPVSAPGATPRQSASEQRPKSCKSFKCLRLWLNTCVTLRRNVQALHHVRRLPRHMTNCHRATLHRLDTLLVASVAFGLSAGCWWLQRTVFTPADSPSIAAAVLDQSAIRLEIITVVSARTAGARHHPRHSR